MSSSVRSFARCVLLVSLAGGCSPGSPAIQIVPKKDLGFDNGDLAGADLAGADLAGIDLAGADLAGVDLAGTATGDMARPWTDKSVSASQDFYSVWSNGSGTAWTTGSTYNSGTMMSSPNTGAIYKSVSNGAFALDPSTMPSGTPNLVSIASSGTGPTLYPLLAVGSGGTAWSYNGTTAWTADTPLNANSLYGVWVAPDAKAWAVGLATAWKRVGTIWGSVGGISNTDAAYNVWGIQTGTGTYSIYAVGALGKIWHSAGTDFTLETSGVSTALYGVWGSSATDIYAVGDVGVILHSTGTGTWTPQTSGVTTPLEGIGGASADEIYIVGDSNTVLQKNIAASTTWVKQTLPNPSASRILLGVWASPTVVYVTGTTGSIFKR